ncbi:hypothetical protein MUN88_11845 [Gracilibacillus caseinilyticus]|uniref:Uncharacterized protein n=1 Tax=Gracilibacillus caseinilyticus TaxID=2932256 RepID=A0ABY4ERE0_9BACI|nr:hypothetical protein [Gracilibacillus caseinilyticus]UOQ46789.1 hypothetical protein MUN88_11845 [Gracilibacillus caseinilyticus]
MTKPKSDKEKDPRQEYELDVDRMINEGMAGGTTYSINGRIQIEQSRKLPKEDEPFPSESD